MPLFPAGPADTSSPRTSELAGPVTAPWRQLAAACGVLVVAAEFAVAPVTLGATVIMLAAGRLTRWSSAWLAWPAVLGAGWAVTEGPRRAAEGFAAGAAHVVAYLASPGVVPAHLARLPAVIGRWRAGLAGQFPLALAAAAAQAAAASRVRDVLTAAGRRARADQGSARAGSLSVAAANDRRRPNRPGLACAARRAYLAAMVSRGNVATVDGACLGVAWDTGRRTALTWAETADGVVLTGRDPALVTRTGLDLTLAAIQHRKAVVIVDLADQAAQVATAVTAACARHGAPLQTWPRAAPGSAAGARQAGDDQSRALAPDSGPGRTADAGGTGIADQFGLAGVLAGRQVLLVRPGSRAPEAGAALARQVAAGLAGALAERRALSVAADGLAWFNGCERAGHDTLAGLLACPRDAGVAMVFGTASGQVAARLAAEAAVIVVRGQPPQEWPGSGPDGQERPSDRNATTTELPALPPRLLAGQRDDDLSLLVRGPSPRMETGYRPAPRSQGKASP